MAEFHNVKVAQIYKETENTSVVTLIFLRSYMKVEIQTRTTFNLKS
jgi:hypothetical protein